jgi:cytochrome c556
MHLTVTLVLAGCVSAEDEQQQAAEGFADHMHGHLDQISAVKAAVIAGDLDAVRAPATWLAEHEQPAGMPSAWAPYVNEMRAQARVAATASDLTTVAYSISEIARSCGDCHSATGFAVAFGYDQRPPEDVQNVTTEMQRHLWAADRMWEGLMGPSDVAWGWGTEMLADVQLNGAQISDDADTAVLVDALAQQVREVGNNGSAAPAGAARSKAYGEFLSLCASCHSLTAGGPGTT